MASLSNRDRIGRMFDLLAPEVEAFLYRGVGTTPENKTWVDVYRAVHRGPADEVNAGDPSVQLKFLAEGYTSRFRPGWRPLRKVFSRTHEAWAGELLQVRHAWAHLRPFSDDDAYRALDTAERFARAINAADAADQMARIRLDLRRVSADKEDRRALRTSAGSNPESAGLRPWREVLTPHEDVSSGNFHASEFAADLYRVANPTGEESRDYSDPVEFFRRTYLTEGLRDLLGRAVRRLAGDDNASPVVNLQTNFGGGKTHAMLGLWHLAGPTPLAAYPQELQDLLGDHGLPVGVRRVALVGQHFAPTGEMRGGRRIHTLWGELAWQLGGEDAYALVADADRSGTSPGGALHELLARYAPAVILIDEWVAYARQLPEEREADHVVVGGTFDAQFTFAQSLTEAAAATSGVLLAVSIPAPETGPGSRQAEAAGSAEEVGGARGLEALRRLQNVVRRVADQWRPASADEAYHIVRRRLFVSPDAQSLTAIGATARAFVELYRKHPDEFPREARAAAYEDRIKQVYPIHPELFDRLYEDWSSLERFQRTRGVLRLMSTVIHALWVGEDASPLIMPGAIPLATSAVNTELAQYLPDQWKAVIDADVDGPHSEPARIDAERTVFGQRSLTRRLARTVFLGAAPTIGAAQKGIETRRVFLGTATPGDVPGNFHAALTALGDRATYFYSAPGKYWYDLQANVTRRAKDQAERMHPEEVWAEIGRRLRGQARTPGDFAAVHVCPDGSADIPDHDEARLVILHPRLAHTRRRTDTTAVEFARSATENRGTGHRTFRNMVVYLAADADRMAELDAAVRDYLAWTAVLSSVDLDLTQNQRSQAKERHRLADQTVESRLLLTYQWALVPEQPDPARPCTIAESRIEGSAPALAERVSRRLGSDAQLNTTQAAAAIRIAIGQIPTVWERGHVSVGALWQLFASYPYLPRLRDQEVLNRGVRDQPLLWQQEGFALADGFDGERYGGLTAGHGELAIQVTNGTLLVRPDVAQRQLDADGESPEARGAASGAMPRGLFVEVEDGVHVRTHRTTRFTGSTTLHRDRCAAEFGKVAEEVIAHLATDDARLTVRVEIEADSPTGFDETIVRAVSENAATLRFDRADFERED